MQTVLVTGSSGYIGSHLVYLMLEAGFKVLGYDKKEFPIQGLEGFEPIRGDLLDRSALQKSFTNRKIDGIFHLASSSDMSQSFDNPSAYLEQERRKMQHLLELANHASGLKYFVFASSCSVYGDVVTGGALESDAPDPRSPYAQAKVESENQLIEACGGGNFSGGILRFFNVIGCLPSKGLIERHDPESHLLPLIVDALLSGKAIEVFGDDFATPDGSAIRDYVDVSDICSGLMNAASYLSGKCASVSNCEIWNLGSGNPTSVFELIQRATQEMNTTAIVRIAKRRPGDPARASAPSGKANQELSWFPKVSLSDSIRNVVTAFSQNGASPNNCKQ